MIFMAGFTQDIWLIRRVGAGLSRFADRKDALRAKPSTRRQSCEILAVMQTRKPADCVQRQVEVQILYKVAHHENHKRHL